MKCGCYSTLRYSAVRAAVFAGSSTIWLAADVERHSKNPRFATAPGSLEAWCGSSAVTPRTGHTHKPKLVTDGQMGVTFIGHSSFFLQIGGQNVVIDPNFARWLFVLKRLRQPGLQVRDLPAIDLVLVTHAHFDHLHRPSLRAIVQQTKRRHGMAPTIVVPHHVFDLVSDLGFDNVVELDWWNSYRHRGLTVTHVPSRHWGARVIEDSHRGYGGYVLRDQQAFDLPRRRHGLLLRLPRNRAAAGAGTGAVADWRLQSAVVSQCSHQSGRCHAGFL